MNTNVTELTDSRDTIRANNVELKAKLKQAEYISHNLSCEDMELKREAERQSATIGEDRVATVTDDGLAARGMHF